MTDVFPLLLERGPEGLVTTSLIWESAGYWRSVMIARPSSITT